VLVIPCLIIPYIHLTTSTLPNWNMAGTLWAPNGQVAQSPGWGLQLPQTPSKVTIKWPQQQPTAVYPSPASYSYTSPNQHVGTQPQNPPPQVQSQPLTAQLYVPPLPTQTLLPVAVASPYVYAEPLSPSSPSPYSVYTPLAPFPPTPFVSSQASYYTQLLPVAMVTPPSYIERPVCTHHCLSEWHPSPFVASISVSDDPLSRGHPQQFTFVSAGQYIAARKALLFRDFAAFKEIVSIHGMTRADMRRIRDLRRAVRVTDHAVWNTVKFRITLEAHRMKYEQNEHLRLYLLGMGPGLQVCTSTFNPPCSIGQVWTDPRVMKHQWGTSCLERVLMKVREFLQFK
jgi:ribA/ribD-fused uncharacterized protein